MREVGAFEAKNNSGLCSTGSRTARILITRRGKAVALLVPAEPGFDRERPAGSGGIPSKPVVASRSEASEIKDLVNEGRP